MAKVQREFQIWILRWAPRIQESRKYAIQDQNKSIIKNSRPIYTKLHERRKREENVHDEYQLAKTREYQHNDSMNSDKSEANKSLYLIERKKLTKRPRTSLLKTGWLELSTGLNESKDDWIQYPTIEEDYINSYGPKRRTKIDLRGKKKLTRFESQPVFDL